MCDYELVYSWSRALLPWTPFPGPRLLEQIHTTHVKTLGNHFTRITFNPPVPPARPGLVRRL